MKNRPIAVLLMSLHAKMLFNQVVVNSFVAYCVSTAIVFLGLGFGASCLAQSHHTGHLFNYHGERYANWDGQWYKQIAAIGYNYSSDAQSSINFFPAYPLLGRAIARLTGLATDRSLCLLSNLCFFCTIVIIHAHYSGDDRDPAHGGLGAYSAVALCFWPTSFFFRMAYSDSLFLLLVTVVLCGIERGWPPIALAALIGYSTATRAVGVGLLPAFTLYVWSRSRTAKHFAAQCLYLYPITLWGILCFAFYQHREFGDVAAFSRTQTHWYLRHAIVPGEKVQALLEFEPIWCVYSPSSKTYWRNDAISSLMPLNYHASEPLFFISFLALALLGWWLRWLSCYQGAAALGLILTPYIAVGYENIMIGMGRYASVAVPVYLVLGRLLGRLPAAAATSLVSLGGVFVGLYAAMFAAWYFVL